MGTIDCRPELTIRQATPLDLPAILALWTRLQDVAAAAEPALATSAAGRAWYQDYLLQRMNDASSSLLIAVREPFRIGYSFAQIHQRPTLLARRCGFIAEVVVQEDHRQQGVGRRLVEAQVDWLRTQGIQRIEVQVLDNNPDAAAFWERMGFGSYLRTLAREV